MNSRALALTGIFSATGVLHFVRPKTFDSIVPPSLGNRRFWTYASGAAELGCAALVAVPATRRIGGLCSAALLIAVFPANIYTVKKYWRRPRGRAVALARLPLQIPLVHVAWKITADADKDR